MLNVGISNSCYNRSINIRENFSGREDELELLLDRWGRCLQGKGSCVIILGESGVGKTRLLDEMEKRVMLSTEVRVCRVDFHPERERPLIPFLNALDRFRSATSNAHSSYDWESSGTIFDDEEELMIFDHYLHDLLEIADKVPLLLRLEDIQWADSSSLRLVRFLARRSLEHPLMLVATAREEELVWKESEMKGTTEDLLREMSLEGDSIVLHLHNLDRFDSANMLSRTLPLPLGTELSDAIYEESEGNPLFALWYLEVLLDSGQLEDRNGFIYAKEHIVSIIPKGVKELIYTRLKLLDPEEVRAVEAASIIGTNFNAEWLEPFFPLGNSLDLLDAVQKKSRVVCSQEGVYRFNHELFRLSIYDSIPLVKRAEMHSLLAEWLERTGTYVPLAYLADQFELGGREEKARLYSWRAGREYQDHFAAAEALHYFQRVVQSTPERDPLWLDAMEGIGDSHFELGHFQEASDIYDRLYHEFRSSVDQDRMLIRLVDCWVPGRLGVGRPVKVEELLAKVKDIKSLDLGTQGEYWGFMSNLHEWNNERQASIESSQKALECFRKADRWERVGTEMVNLGFMKSLEHPLKSISTFMSVQDIYKEHPYIHGEMDLNLALGEAYLNLGLLVEANEIFSISLDRAKIVGERSSMVWNHYYLSLIALLQSDLDNALAHVHMSLEAASIKGIRLLSCLPLWVAVVAHVLRPDLIQAQVVYKELSRRYNEYRSDYKTAVDGLVVCAREILCAAKNPEHALTRFEEGIKLLEMGQFTSMYQLFCRYFIGLVLAERGRRKDALEQWNKAEELADHLCNLPMMDRISMLLEELEPIAIVDTRDLL